jgi:alpha-beta hydrolase superfamily lysophospholipase
MVAADETPTVPRRLVFYVPPLTGKFEDWAKVVRRFRREPGHENDTFEQARAYPGLFTWGKLEDFAGKLVNQIDEIDRGASPPYDEIILVANSIGSLVARWAWLSAAGEIDGSERRAWAAKVTRIVLVAGLSRGVFTRLKKTEHDQQRPGPRMVAIKALSTCPGKFAWKDALAGKPFVTELRLRWMRLDWIEAGIRHAAAPDVVQLLGTEDGLVRRDDSLDTEQFRNATHVDVPDAKHTDILDLDGKDAEVRYQRIRSALIDPLPALEEGAPPGLDRIHIRNVVFVVHGIRVRFADWVEALRDLLDDKDSGWRAVAPTYGFFSALAFALPFSRHRKVRWFLDQYSDEVARHPDATFHFAGHSNGTFLLGHALETVGAVKFDHVYLAGSVLPSDFGWEQLRVKGRVCCVRSDCGSNDLPVGLLARGLSPLPRNDDIGAGGFVGFDGLAEGFGKQLRWVKGGHGAPLQTCTRRTSVANFIRGLEGDVSDVVREPSGLLRAGSQWARRGVPLLLLCVLAAPLVLWLTLGSMAGLVALGGVVALVVAAGLV